MLSKHNKLGLMLIVFLISSYSIHADEWEKNVDKKGIQVYTRLVKGNNLKDTKSVMTIQSSMDRFLKSQFDFPNYPTWVPKCSAAMLLKKMSDSECIYRCILKIPMVQNRDLVVHLKLRRIDKDNCIIELKGVPDFIPRDKDYIRMPRLVSSWIVKNIGGNKLHLVQVNSYDPGGKLPDFLINMAATTTPFESFENLRTILEKP
ncbi:MAG: hypothetical protein KA797_05425 [Chitinophagales bacterium]|nr:hypothetical protein [Chitinophagales bacterium]